MYIYCWIGSIRISCGHGPAFIHDDIRYSIVGGKVNEVFISIQITACYKVYIRSVRGGTIPPFPACQSRFNPRSIFQYIFLRKLIGHGIFYQLFVVCADDKVAPGKTAFSIGSGNVACFFLYFEATISVFTEFQRNFGKYGRHAVIAITFKK